MYAEQSSHSGIIVDPYKAQWDDHLADNSASTAFIFTGPLTHGFFDPAGENYIDITHVNAQADGTYLAVTVTFSAPINTQRHGSIPRLPSSP